MNNGWIKYFFDGPSERGLDDDVVAGKASWSRGRLGEMNGAELSHEGRSIFLSGSGEFWQSDLFEVSSASPAKTLVARRLQKKISGEDRYACFLNSGPIHSVLITGEPSSEDAIWSNSPRSLSGEVGQWFVVELDVRSGSVDTYVSQEKA